MVILSQDDNIYVKIVIWGCSASGKTQLLETMYDLCKSTNKGLVSTGNLVKIDDKSSGVTLYFDRLILQSKENYNLFFHYYSVAGAKHRSAIREKIGIGMDGVIFIVDSQRERLYDNFDSFNELRRLVKENFKQKIPLTIILNKCDLEDLEDTITLKEWKDYLSDSEKSLDGPDSPFALNSLMYKTSLINDNNKYDDGIYEIISQTARRTLAYAIHGSKSTSNEEDFTYEHFYQKNSEFMLADSNDLDQLIKPFKMEREEKKREEDRIKKAMLQKIKQILSVSTKLRMDMMRTALDLDEKTFIDRIFDWAFEFGFKIDGDFIIMGDADIEGFIAQLDQQFKNWNRTGKVKDTETGISMFANEKKLRNEIEKLTDELRESKLRESELLEEKNDAKNENKLLREEINGYKRRIKILRRDLTKLVRG